MNHPTSALAEYVDGTLAPEARAEVSAHLEACAACRDEVAAGEIARTALRGLPAVTAPASIGDRAVAEARRAAAGDETVRPLRPRRAPSWTRWAAVAGVAAAIGLLAVVLPDLGGGGDRAGVDLAEPTAGDVGPAASVEFVDTDLGVAEIQSLALGYGANDATAEASVEAGGVADGGATGSAASAPIAVREAKSSPAAIDRATACLETAFGPLPAPPVRLLRGTFEGTPAVIGVVLSGPGAGQAPDTADVYVAAAKDCTILSSTRAQI